MDTRQDASVVLTSSLPLHSDGVKVVVISAIFITLGTITVVLRFYARHFRRSSYGLEDWLVLSSLILFYGYGTAAILAVCIGGIGYHVTELNPSQLQLGLKILLALQILYAVGLGLIKCSICLMLSRIFFIKRFRIAASLVAIFCAAWAVMTILIAFLLCLPLNYNWNLLPTAGHCGNQPSAYAAVGIIDIISDLTILILPLPMIWQLQLPMANKIGLAGILCLGIFTVAMSIARVVSIFNTNFADFTHGTYNFVWPVLEFGVAIIVCCAPLLRPLFARYFPLISKSSRRTEGESNGSEPFKRIARSGFNQLNERRMPLQSINVPGCITTIGTTDPQDHKQNLLELKASHKEGWNSSSHGASIPQNTISVETGWDVTNM